MTRDEYQSRQREMCARGMALPQAKLMDLDIGAIRSAVVQRENLRQYIRDNLSNDALAVKFGVHRRTIEKVIQGYSWSHL